MDTQTLSSLDQGTEFEEDIDSIEAQWEPTTSTCPPGTSPHQRQTTSFLAFLADLGAPEVCQRVVDVLEYMESLQLNLPILLWALCWNETYPGLVTNHKARFARTGLTTSELLPGILKRWHRPPRAHGRGIRTEAAHRTMENWALETICDVLDKESDDLEESQKFPQEGLSQDTFLAINWGDMISNVKSLAPVTWKLFRHAASTKLQEKRNTHKTPEAAVFTMISMASLSRSHHRCKLAKLLTIYLKSCGLAARAFDTLHALGITMSQKWVYKGINALTMQQQVMLLKDVKKYPWFGVYDNVNIQFKAFQQRIDNQNHFDSGTAATILVLKNPLARWPDRDLRLHQRALGAGDLISGGEILILEADSGPRIHSHAVSLVLRFLVDSPDFDFENYAFKDDPVFSPCPPGQQLPIGKEYIPCQYVLKTAHIEETSYEGNERVLVEWWRQLERGTLSDQKGMGENQTIVWVGDQSTVARLRGLQNSRCEDHNSFDRLDFLVPVFGWFHAQMAIEHSIHAQYYGTQQGFGLIHAFDLLKRKGLSSPSIQGNFHNNLREALLHVTEARFRDIWCVVGKVDTLKELRKRSPAELHSLAVTIVSDYASSGVMYNLATRGERCDELLYQSIQMARDLLDYVLLDRALTSGDIGLLEDLIPRLLFRLIGGGSKNYTIEVLELLQGLHREWPTDLKDFIRQNCWLANTTGRPNSFEPIDLLQEHNVRDIKDHVERTLNHFCRGKSHTSPGKEEDVARLQASYRDSKIHHKIRGRKLESQHKTKDYVAHGMQNQSIAQVLARWSESRVREWSSEEYWNEEITQQN